MEELTQEEKQMIIDLLNRVQISPLDPNAIKSIELIQSTVKKLNDKSVRDTDEKKD